MLERRVIKSNTVYQLLGLVLWALGGVGAGKYLASCTAEKQSGFCHFFLYCEDFSVLYQWRIYVTPTEIQRQLFYYWFWNVTHYSFLRIWRVCTLAGCGLSLKSEEKNYWQRITTDAIFKKHKLLANLNYRSLIIFLKRFSVSHTISWA